MASTHSFLTSREAFESFLATWEAGTLPKSEWTHAAHVAVGAAYTVRFGPEAFTAMRAGIRRYNEAVGTANTETSGYHETLTGFWSAVLAKVCAQHADEHSAAREAVQEFGEQRKLHEAFYSFDVVRSMEARRTWIPPDREGPFSL